MKESYGVKSCPPRWADKLLEYFCSADLLEEVQGDLHEEFYYQLQQKGLAKARWHYWIDVLGFLRPFAFKRKSKHYSSPPLFSPDMLRNYFKTAFRHLIKHKVSTLINLCGLTLGITACLVIYLITSYELSYDTFHPEGRQIYRIVGDAKYGANGEVHPVGFMPNAVPFAVREEISGIETVAAFHTIESEVLIPNGKNKPKKFESRKHGVDNSEIIVAEPSYFEIFKYTWLAGNPETALADPFKVVLSEQKAHKYFGTIPLDQIIGKEVIYYDSVRVSVSGIVKQWDHPSDFTFTDFISFATIRASKLKQEINLDEWDDNWSASQAFVKLSKGIIPAQLGPQLKQFSKKHFQKELKINIALQPLADLHFNSDYVDNYSRKAHLPTLYGLMGVAIFILLIAAINFVNLATAQSAQRAKEIGIRKVLGSNRRNLIFQFLGETILLTLTAILFALILVNPILAAFKTLLPNTLEVTIFSLQTVVFLVCVVIATSLLAGCYPAWILSSYLPVLTLKGQVALKGGQKAYFRKGLIIFQFTVSLTFIIGTLIVGQQLNFIRNKDLGFSSNSIISINARGNDQGAVLAQRIKQLSGVESVTMEWFPPMGRSYMTTKLKYQNKKREVEMDVSAKVGDENYIPLYQLRLVAGRNYIKSDSLREIVINVTYAKALGFNKPADALNELIEWQGKKYPIVGVVADFHEQSFHEKISPVFLGYIPQNTRNMGIKLTTANRQFGNLKETLSQIEEQWNKLYPDKKFEFTFLDDSIANLYEKEQKTSQLVNTATLVAILISCMGLFGLATFTAEQRTKEIGIRKIIGASIGSIVALLSKDFLKLVIIAFVIASPIAWYMMHQWLQDFVYKVDIEWWIFMVAGLLAIGIALFTISFQSIRAAVENPIKSLKNE